MHLTPCLRAYISWVKINRKTVQCHICAVVIIKVIKFSPTAVCCGQVDVEHNFWDADGNGACQQRRGHGQCRWVCRLHGRQSSLWKEKQKLEEEGKYTLTVALITCGLIRFKASPHDNLVAGQSGIGSRKNTLGCHQRLQAWNQIPNYNCNQQKNLCIQLIVMHNTNISFKQLQFTFKICISIIAKTEAARFFYVVAIECS